MFYLLRMIKTGRWNAAQDGALWLQQDEILADPMADFSTEQGSLSLYRVDHDLSNLERVVAALAINRPNPDNFDYGIIAYTTLTESGFNLQLSPGNTRDEEVNSFHYDMIELSTRRVLDLTHLFFHHNVRLTRVPRVDVIQYAIKYRDSNDLKGVSKKWQDVLS